MPDGYDQAATQRIDVYRQAYALIEALWQPLVARGLINEKGPGPAKLSDWIKVHIGPSFPLAQDANPDRSKAYLAFHAWSEYQPGDFDDYFWGAAGSKHTGADLGEGAEPGLAQLLPKELFDKLCCMLSTTTDARIPQRPYDAQFDDPTEGLWFYGLHHFDRLADGGELDLTDQYCQRGIGPDGQLVLRSRPFGELVLRSSEPNRYRDRRFLMERGNAERTRDEMLNDMRLVFLARYTDTPKRRNAPLDEEELWKAQYQNNRLRTVLEKHRLGSGSSTDDGMQTGLRAALDLAVCLPYAIVLEVEKRLGAAAREELFDSLLEARVHKPNDTLGEGTALFTPKERNELATIYAWPSTAQGLTAAVTCSIVRLLLGQEHTAGEALANHLAHIAGDNAHAMALQVQSYLEEVAAWSNTLDIRGREGDRATYEELYIPPAFHLQPNTLQRCGRGFGKREVATSEEVNPASFLSQLATKRNRGGCARLLIQAGSGMGKTTYVKGLSAGIAQARINGDATIFTLLTQSEQSAPLMEWTPVLIAQPEGDLAGTGFEALGRDEKLTADEFADFLYCQLPDTLKDPLLAATSDDDAEARKLFKMLLGSRDTLVIVDSIDEVPIAVRDRYIAQLAELVEVYQINRLVVTSRPLEGESEARLKRLVGGTVISIEAFDLARQRKLFNRLVRAFGSPAETSFEASGTSADILSLDDIVQTPGFETITGNPLILTALVRALLQSNPDERVSAFGVLDTLVSLLPKIPEKGPFAYDGEVLERIAFELTCGMLTDPAQKQAGDGLPLSVFISTFTNYLDKASGVIRNTTQADVIDRLVTRRGVLAVRERHISFEHPLIRALFAARYVLSTLGNDAARYLLVAQRGGASTSEYCHSADGDAQLKALLGAGVRAHNAGRTAATRSYDPAPMYTMLLILSAGNPQAEWQHMNAQTGVYRALCGIVLFDVDESQREHDFAIRMLRAAQRFDFGRPCPRTPQVDTWESRLTELSGHSLSNEDGEIEPAVQMSEAAGLS